MRGGHPAQIGHYPYLFSLYLLRSNVESALRLSWVVAIAIPVVPAAVPVRFDSAGCAPLKQPFPSPAELGSLPVWPKPHQSSWPFTGPV